MLKCRLQTIFFQGKVFADNTACTGWYRNSRKHLIISSCTVYTVHYSVQGTNIFIVYSTGCPNKHGD